MVYIRLRKITISAINTSTYVRTYAQARSTAECPASTSTQDTSPIVQSQIHSDVNRHFSDKVESIKAWIKREAGCFRQVVELYSYHYRQVPLYIKCLDQGRPAALDRWLHYTVTTIDRFHCTSNVWTRGGWPL